MEERIRRWFHEGLDRALGREGAFERELEAVELANQLWSDYEVGQISLDGVKKQLSELGNEDALKERVAKKFFFLRYHSQYNSQYNHE